MAATIPELNLNVPMVGNRWAVGLAFQMHLVFVAFVMGIALVAPAAEALGLRRPDQHWERLARELSKLIGQIFSFGATWAAFALVLLFGLYPRLVGILSSIFFWPLVVIAVVWVVMTLSAYGYYHTWERLRARRGWHMAIGWTFAASAFLFITLVTELSSYQLTPTNPTSLLAAALNPSWPTEILHRQIGNPSYACLLLASYAGIRGLRGRGNGQDRAYHDWLGHYALLIGAGLALLQPIGGWLYARQVQVGSPGAYYRMMIGENAWLFLIQIALFGVVLFLGNVYMAAGIERGEPGRRTKSWIRNSLWMIGILVLLGAVPQQWPLGQMRPWKYISLGGLVLFSLVNLVLYVRASRGFVWGRAGRGAHLALAVLGVAIVALIVTMGIIRTSARGGDTIYNRLGPGYINQQLEQR